MIRSNFNLKHVLAGIALALGAGFVPPAAAQSGGGADPPPVKHGEVDRTYLERVALGRARSRLATRVYALPLVDRQTIGGWAAQSPSLDRALRSWLRTIPKSGPVRIYSDGTSDVDVRLTPEILSAHLAELRDAQKDPPAPPLTDAQLHSTSNGWTEMVCSGSAAIEDQNERTKKYPGWEDVSADGVQLCRQAALADAWAALLEQAGRLKVTPARRLDSFLGSSEKVHDAVREALMKAAAAKIEFGADQVAQAEIRISIPDFIRILTQVHQDAYEGDEFKGSDFREMALNSNLSELRATGLATPPGRYRLSGRYELIELDAPGWAKSDLVGVGAYTTEDADAQPEDTQVELTRLDGANNLRRQAEALIVRPGITVAEYLSLHQELKDDVVLWLAGTHIVGKPQRSADGALKARVELSAVRLWQILRRGIHPVEVEAPESQPTSLPVDSPENHG